MGKCSGVIEFSPGRYKVSIDRWVDQGLGVKKRVRVRKQLPEGTSATQAHAVAAKLKHDFIVKPAVVSPADGWTEYVDGLSDGPSSWLRQTTRHMKNRSHKSGRDGVLTTQQIKQLLLRSRGRCEVTGLKFRLEQAEGQRKRRPFFYSVDRIDSGIGYTIENSRVVCLAVNIAMNSWGEEVFAELARGFVFNRYSAFHASNP